MSDLVERLRDTKSNWKIGVEICDEAADEIERLLAVLREILDLLSDGPGGPRRLTAIDVARAAVEEFEESKLPMSQRLR